MDFENIKNNEQLKDLSDEQIKAVSELIANNENTKIAEKTREIWDSVDADIQAVTGKQKPPNVKSYNFLKDVLTENINNLSDISSKYDQAAEQISSLETSLKDNTGDEKLKGIIADHESVIAKLRQDIEAKENEKIDAVNEAQKQNNQLRFDNVFNEALRGVKFKPGIPEISLDATLNTAKQQIMSIGSPEFVDGKITFKDDKGLTITDPNNLQKPMTAKEQFIKAISPIIDGGKTLEGTGSEKNRVMNESSYLADFKTRVEADKKISEHLAKSGLAKGTVEYQAEKDKLWNTNNVSSLPLR